MQTGSDHPPPPSAASTPRHPVAMHRAISMAAC
jgi:hypothetical protein